jgi:hypothetical protein
MTSSMYALATASASETPKTGKRKSGAMDATASGTASVIHQMNTQASTPSMLRAAVCWAPRSTSAQISAAARGPAATDRYLFANTDLSGEQERRAPSSVMLSCRGSSGLVTSSDELSQCPLHRGSMAGRAEEIVNSFLRSLARSLSCRVV